MRTATIAIPFSAIADSIGDGNPIMTTSIRNEMNGKNVCIENEYEFIDSAMIDWDRYDYVTPLPNSDAYSWHKSWLTDIKDDTPIGKQKIWSVWVDGVEMNSYKLDYEQALDMRDDLVLEDDYKESEIIIDDTYNINKQNVKYLIENALIRYKSKRSEMQEYRDNLEYEAAPSGEVNESMIPMDLAETEIDVYDEVIVDMEEILENGIFA